MAAWLCFATDTPLPLEQLHEALVAAGVVYGIDTFLLQDLAEAHQPGHLYRIAQGSLPEDGLEYFFSRHQERTPRRLAHGKVDFYNLDTIQNVVQQQILVAKVPPEARKPGTTVTGKVIPPSDQQVPLPRAGTNVACTADGNALIAQINGYPVLSEHTLRVDPFYTLAGNVDFTVGNLTCIGSLVIGGDVKHGFSVKCAQDMAVHGVVEGDITAGGPVHLYGNVFGKHKSHIWSAASVYGTYVDSATLEARKDIVLTRGARYSQLRAGGSVLVQGADSTILGGMVQAHARIRSHNLGSEREVATCIEILPGAFDEDSQGQFFQYLAAMLADDSVGLGHYLGPDAVPESVASMQALLHQCQAALPWFSEYCKRRRQMFPLIPMQIGTVVTTGTAYPGVTIRIGGASLVLAQPMTRVMFYQAQSGIQSRPLDRMDPDLAGAE
jgi:uncharacterized protein (DUF342 family)